MARGWSLSGVGAMRYGLVLCVLAASAVAVACETVTVQVPPEVDLKGIRTVAIQARDLLIDPAPVAVLLRAETIGRMHHRLPALVVTERPEDADALLELEVASHGVGPVQTRAVVNASNGQESCESGQEAYLTVGASIIVQAHATLLWQSVLDARRRIEIDCALPIGPLWALRTPAPVDRQLVPAVVDDLARKLTGYTRTELRPLEKPPATP